MKYAKMLGLLALAAAAFAALAATASATRVTSPAGAVYTGTIKAETETFEYEAGKSVPHAILTGPGGIKVECESTMKGQITSDGEFITASGPIEELAFFNCTKGYAVAVLAKGSIEIHTENTAVSDGNGTVTSTGAEVTVTTPLGFNCIYRTNATDIGRLIGSVNSGKSTATLEIRGAAIPRTGHSPFCGMNGLWSGNYKITQPDYLDVD